MLSRTLDVGTLDPPHLRTALADAAVRLNDGAETLLLDPAFDRQTPERLDVVRRTVRELGFGSGAAMSAILTAACAQDLVPCDHGAVPAAGLYRSGVRARLRPLERFGTVGVADGRCDSDLG